MSSSTASRTSFGFRTSPHCHSNRVTPVAPEPFNRFIEAARVTQKTRDRVETTDLVTCLQESCKSRVADPPTRASQQHPHDSSLPLTHHRWAHAAIFTPDRYAARTGGAHGTRRRHPPMDSLIRVSNGSKPVNSVEEVSQQPERVVGSSSHPFRAVHKMLRPTRVPSGKRSTRSTRTPGSPNNNVVPSNTGPWFPSSVRKRCNSQTSEGQGPPHATTRPMRAKSQLPA